LAGILGRLHRQGARAVSPPEGQPRHKGTIRERQFLSRGRDFLAMQGREESDRGNQTLSLEAQAGPSASKARRYSFFPFSLRGDAPQPPTASEVVAPRSAAAVEVQTAPTEVRRRRTRGGDLQFPGSPQPSSRRLVGICFQPKSSPATRRRSSSRPPRARPRNCGSLCSGSTTGPRRW
jgi:hypothetical protein